MVPETKSGGIAPRSAMTGMQGLTDQSVSGTIWMNKGKELLIRDEAGNEEEEVGAVPVAYAAGLAAVEEGELRITKKTTIPAPLVEDSGDGSTTALDEAVEEEGMGTVLVMEAEASEGAVVAGVSVGIEILQEHLPIEQGREMVTSIIIRSMFGRIVRLIRKPSRRRL